MKIANIINFVRAVEPRAKDDSYLIGTLREELALCRKYGFRSTVLLQYDALIRKDYLDLLKEYEDMLEIGLWFEVVEPLANDCGIPWRGRFPWDWHNDVGFLIGYTPKEREMLIDCAFGKFEAIFGYTPTVAGSWHIDAYSLRYMSEKYHILASCNCKEQCGTDGYTIRGGFFNGAYYPCINNMLCPAVSEENQINVPVFRMLGPDPVAQYDMGLGSPDKAQKVTTLEPVYGNAGADRQWVEWYLSENFNGKELALAYTQFGQENSFGWERISPGLPMQFEILDRKLKNKELELMTLGEAGKLFSALYKTTPPQTICTDSDSTGTGTRSIWYQCRKYRANLLLQNGVLRLRDLYLYDDDYRERYLDKRVTGHNCGYYALPVIDGFRFSKDGVIAGGYFIRDDVPAIPEGEYLSSVCEKDNTASVFFGKNEIVRFSEDGIRFTLPDRFSLRIVSSADCNAPYRDTDGRTLRLSAREEDGENGFDYRVTLNSGRFVYGKNGIDIFPENNIINIII